jgi:hypothetical protein
MDIIAAYREVGSYRGAAAMCNTTHRTVKRAVRQREEPDPPVEKAAERTRNYDIVAGVAALLVGLLSAAGTALRRRIFQQPDLSIDREGRSELYRSLSRGDRYRARQSYAAWLPSSSYVPKVLIALGVPALAVAGVATLL